MVSGKKQSEQQQVLIVSANKELREKERIDNVIISGAGAGNSDDQDMAKVDEVLQALNLGASKAKDASRPTGQRERVTQST